ncbi:hypothetical protein ACFLXO_04905 [Chloroflexota bacterium]
MSNHVNYGREVVELAKISNPVFLLVEPVLKTPYPPLGLMKIGTMLRNKYEGCKIITQSGMNMNGLREKPDGIFITSLFTWDWKLVADAAKDYRRRFPGSDIVVGGIAASLLKEEMELLSEVKVHQGLYDEAEKCAPDYSLTFGRKCRESISFTTRGCPNKCKFCSVRELEPKFFVKDDWVKDLRPELGRIVFWDNNFLASPNFAKDAKILSSLGKKVDFNQGLEARLYDEEKARCLAKVDVDPIRFAFDDIRQEEHVLKAIRLAKKYSRREVCAYALYNFEDTPEDLFHRMDLLNTEGCMCFPMEYRPPSTETRRFPNKYWNGYLLRAFKLSLLFYYRRGMITESRESFQWIYGHNAKEFVANLYEIYEYDKNPDKGKNARFRRPA